MLSLYQTNRKLQNLANTVQTHSEMIESDEQRNFHTAPLSWWKCVNVLVKAFQQVLICQKRQGDVCNRPDFLTLEGKGGSCSEVHSEVMRQLGHWWLFECFRMLMSQRHLATFNQFKGSKLFKCFIYTYVCILVLSPYCKRVPALNPRGGLSVWSLHVLFMYAWVPSSQHPKTRMSG